MGYIENNLANDEKIMARIKHSWAGLVSTAVRVLVLVGLGILMIYLPNIVEKIVGEKISGVEGHIIDALVIVISVFMFLLALVVLLVVISEIRSAELVVTNKRIFGRRGFISKYTTDIMLSKVDTINVNNGFFGAIFHYGTIEIVSGATGGMSRVQRATLCYAYISNTEEFRKAVLDTIEKVKEEERIAQALSLSEAMKNNKQ